VWFAGEFEFKLEFIYSHEGQIQVKDFGYRRSKENVSYMELIWLTLSLCIYIKVFVYRVEEMNT
jgi:hypothetical protein